MECAAVRTEADAEDIKFLAERLRLRSSGEVLSAAFDPNTLR
jgi:hypothetical protein